MFGFYNRHISKIYKICINILVERLVPPIFINKTIKFIYHFLFFTYMKPGLYTLDMIAKQKGITIPSARNYLTILRKKGLVQRSGKIYQIFDKPPTKDNGFFSIANKTPVKLVPSHIHRVYGKKYTVEDAIVQALSINESRYLAVAAFLCNKVTHWTNLVRMLKKKQLLPRFKAVYQVAKQSIRVKKIPLKYKKILEQIQEEDIYLNKYDIWSYK